jgi:hypothetical protein
VTHAITIAVTVFIFIIILAINMIIDRVFITIPHQQQR